MVRRQRRFGRSLASAQACLTRALQNSGRRSPRLAVTHSPAVRKRQLQMRRRRGTSDLVEQIRPLVERGREYKDAVAEVFATNAQLLTLWRHQSTKKKRKKR